MVLIKKTNLHRRNCFTLSCNLLFRGKVKSLLSAMVRLRKSQMSQEKKTAVSQYNVEGKQLEAFLGPLEASILEIIWGFKKRPIP